MKSENKLFVLSGPSAIGKATILSKIAEEKLCNIAPKYSSRKKREAVFDDIIPVSKEYIEEFCEEINYEMYGNLYGFNINEIKKDLNECNLIAICSDIDSIKKMKEIFDEKFSAIFIYIQDIFVENLVKAFLERKELYVDNELLLLANQLSKSLKTKNKYRIIKNEQIFENKIKELLSNTDYKEFVARYKSLIDADEYYHKNKDLFNHTVSEDTIDELIERCRKIIKKQEYV